jgi:hypothetical protein
MPNPPKQNVPLGKISRDVLLYFHSCKAIPMDWKKVGVVFFNDLKIAPYSFHS